MYEGGIRRMSWRSAASSRVPRAVNGGSGGESQQQDEINQTDANDGADLNCRAGQI